MSDSDTPEQATPQQPPQTKERLYLDTTVPSAWLDDRVPDRRDQTRQFWEKALPRYNVFVSEITLREILRTPNLDRRERLRELVEPFGVLDLSDAAEGLAQTFIDDGLLNAKKEEDVLHLAIAVVNGMDILASWNYDDMVNIRVKKLLPMLSVKHGYFHQLMILTPKEFL